MQDTLWYNLIRWIEEKTCYFTHFKKWRVVSWDISKRVLVMQCARCEAVWEITDEEKVL